MNPLLSLLVGLLLAADPASGERRRFRPLGGGRFGPGLVDLVFAVDDERPRRARDGRGREIPLARWPGPRDARRHWWCAADVPASGRAELTLHLRRVAREARPDSARVATRLATGWLLVGRGLRVQVPDAAAILLRAARTATRGPDLIDALVVEGEGQADARLEIRRRDARGLELVKQGTILVPPGRLFSFEHRYRFRPGAGRLDIAARFTSRDTEGRGPAIRATAARLRGARAEEGESIVAPPFDYAMDRDGDLRSNKATTAVSGGPTQLPALAVGAARRGLRLRFPDAEHHTPFRLAVSSAEALTVELVADDLDWWPGQRAGRDLVLERGDPDRPFAADLALETSPGAAPPLLPGLAAEVLPRVAAAYLSRPWKGQANAGDFRWGRGTAGNLEYDHVGGLLHLARTGTDHALPAARRALRHLLERDLDRAATGLPRRHGPRHRGPVELGHIWIEGPLDLAFAAADRGASEDLVGILEALRRRIDARREGTWTTRDLGWSLLALVVAHERFGAPPDARRIEDLLAVWLDSLAGPWPRLDPLPRGDADFVSSWVGPGVLGEVLARAPRSATRRRARAAFGRLLDALLSRVVDEREGMVHRGVVVGREGGVGVARGTLEGEEIYFLVLGVARAAEWEGRGDGRLSGLRALARRSLRCEEVPRVGKRLSQLLWVASRTRISGRRSAGPRRESGG